MQLKRPHAAELAPLAQDLSEGNAIRTYWKGSCHVMSCLYYLSMIQMPTRLTQQKISYNSDFCHIGCSRLLLYRKGEIQENSPVPIV